MSTETVLRANVRELQEQVSRLQARLAEVIAERDEALSEIKQLKHRIDLRGCAMALHQVENAVREMALHHSGDATEKARTEPPTHRCRGVPDRECPYLAPCDSPCNKCGRIHDNENTPDNPGKE